jgi:two-component system sensor histidine kinase MtrB
MSPFPGMVPKASHRQRFGLKARVTAAFAALAAVLSGVLAGTTYALVHHYLLAERETAATHETYADARVVKRSLALSGADLEDVLSSLSAAKGTVALVYRGGKWYSAAVALGEPPSGTRPAGVTAALVKMVAGGTPARQRVMDQGEPAVAIGVPMPAVHASYFEIHSLSELASTLNLLAVVLLACSLATTAGGLLVGRWAAGRLARPVRETAEVAAAIAQGALGRRLAEGTDPDLAVLATSFNEMVEALEARIKRDARFASDVSHELRSPLTTIQAALDLLQGSEEGRSPEGRQALQLLSTEIARFSSMVQDLLEISRFDAGAAADFEEIDLADLVEGTVGAYTDATVPVSVPKGGEGLWALGDRRRLQRVLVNLLDNARLHAGGAVGVGLAQDGHEAVITVDDAGPGIDPAERAAIFERFYRGAAAGWRAEGSGTGLGLALVAEHLKAHRGRVVVGDRPGGGARFEVRLPLLPQPPERHHHPEHHHHPERQHHPKHEAIGGERAEPLERELL